MTVEELEKLKESDVLSITAGELAELIASVREENIQKQYKEYIESLIDNDKDHEIEYPNQISSVVRSKKTLGIDAFLAIPDTKNGQSPLELHAGYSRFVMTIIDATSGSAQFVHANIHPDEIELIKEKTKLATEKMFMRKNSWEATSEETLSPAYTVAMTSKEIAKKTPAELLNEDPANRAKLEAARAWLESNLSRYPNNQTQIDAIDDAIALFDTGLLKSVKSESKIIDIYREDIKIPNSKKLDPKHHNKTFVYSISIVCQLGQDYPFAVNIMNCYATPKKTSMGIVAEMSSAEATNKFSILLTEKEWNKVITKMEKNVTLFEQMNYKDLYNVAKSKSFFK